MDASDLRFRQRSLMALNDRFLGEFSAIKSGTRESPPPPPNQVSGGDTHHYMCMADTPCVGVRTRSPGYGSCLGSATLQGLIHQEGEQTSFKIGLDHLPRRV